MNQHDRELARRRAKDLLAYPTILLGVPAKRPAELARHVLTLLAELERVEAERDAAEAALAQERERAAVTGVPRDEARDRRVGASG